MRSPIAPVLVLAAAALLCAAAQARAENPKLSLKLQGVGLRAALSQLSEATGVRVELESGQVQPDYEAAADFDWSGTSLARVLHQLCEKYRLASRRSTYGYTLYPAPPAPAASPRVGLIERHGIRLFARSVSVEDHRSRNFMGEAAAFDESKLQLQLFAELRDGDGDTIARVENLTAVDDLGDRLTADSALGINYAIYSCSFPDQWAGTYSLRPLNARARKLRSLEGELIAYRSVKSLHMEIPLPLEAKSVRRQAGDWLIAVSQYHPDYREPADDDDGLPDLAAHVPEGGPSVRLRIYTPVQPSVTARLGWNPYPTLVDAAGNAVQPFPTGGRGAGNGQITLTDTRLVFPATPARPVKLVWNLVEKSNPYKLFSFKMTDLPLPDGAPAGPRISRAAPASRDSLPADHPYYQAGGGAVVTRVLLGDKPAPGGRLQLGLTPKRAGGWGALRWTEVEVDLDGIARLDSVRPGVYRIQRVYKAEPGAPPLSAGVWQNPAVLATVAAGKDAAVLPLRRSASSGR